MTWQERLDRFSITKETAWGLQHVWLGPGGEYYGDREYSHADMLEELKIKEADVWKAGYIRTFVDAYHGKAVVEMEGKPTPRQMEAIEDLTFRFKDVEIYIPGSDGRHDRTIPFDLLKERYYQ